MKLIAWMNSNYGTVVSGVAGIVGTVAIAAIGGFGASILVSQGRIESELGHIKESDKTQTAELQAFRAEVNTRFDTLGAALDTNALRQILISTGSVTDKDVFYAAYRQDGALGFPGRPGALGKLHGEGSHLGAVHAAGLRLQGARARRRP